MALSPARTTLVGWLTLVALMALFIGLGLLKLIVFLLFMHLVIDLVVTALGGRVPFVSKRVVLYVACIVVAAGVVALALVVLPDFLADVPDYIRLVDSKLAGKVGELLTSWGVSFDLGELKLKAIEWGRAHLPESFDLAKRAGTNVVLLVFSFVMTIISMHDRLTRTHPSPLPAEADNLWAYLARFLREKIGEFYGFFRQVMGGQVIISAINAGLTFGLLVVLGIPHKVALTVMVFVFGLLPIVGNLISNTLICISALLSAGPIQVIAALVFLVVVHKLEYFLNSKIIGNVVKLPVLITLLGLIVGEALFRISGMILAVPIILFIRAQLRAVRTDFMRNAS